MKSVVGQQTDLGERTVGFQINGLVPELWCSDFDESLRFYTDVLGFSVSQRRGSDPHAYLSLQGSQIMLASWKQHGAWETGPFEQPLGRGINFQILVDNVREMYAGVLAAGVKPFVELYTRWYWRTDRMDKRTEFGILDPDGYLLRFSQVESDRPVEQFDIDELNRKNALSVYWR